MARLDSNRAKSAADSRRSSEREEARSCTLAPRTLAVAASVVWRVSSRRFLLLIICTKTNELVLTSGSEPS